MLDARPEGWSRTARQAIGYKEPLEFLRGQLSSVDHVAEQIMVRTRQFARRQRAWFRRDDRIEWFGADAETGDPSLDKSPDKSSATADAQLRLRWAAGSQVAVQVCSYRAAS